MRTLLRKLNWSITHRGLLGTLRALPKALTRSGPALGPHPFDQRYGTDTSGLIGGGSLATGHSHDVYITAYAGIAPSRLEAALDRWRASIGSARVEDYTFVDLGCGKGRALLLASRMPFREVIGIELNPQLAAIAQHNVERWKDLSEARSQITIQIGDATTPSLPDGPTVLFLYNSFAEPLVQRLAENLDRASTARSVEVIYQNADFAHAFATQPSCKKLWSGSLLLSPEDIQFDPVASPDDLTVIFRMNPR
jgi:SAM-dependent methyltransferase